MPDKSLREGDTLFCDHADAMRRLVDAYDAGFHMMHGQMSVSIERLREWADAMERASVLIEGPAE
ncbi:MAG TPA: hypothetical protein VEA41_09270 [Salinarimonas sp.]|nr:hypothetical protein [Salinarimonas sp.]